jgi:hypothetical protein
VRANIAQDDPLRKYIGVIVSEAPARLSELATNPSSDRFLVDIYLLLVVVVVVVVLIIIFVAISVINIKLD